MIDTVRSLSADLGEIVCDSILPLSSPVFDGHFPGFETMPGVLMIETMAQAAGFLTMARNKGKAMPFLAGVDGARFRNFARPGQALTASARVTHDGSGYVVLEAALCSGEVRLANAVIRLRIAAFPNEELAGHIHDLLEHHNLMPKTAASFAPAEYQG